MKLEKTKYIDRSSSPWFEFVSLSSDLKDGGDLLRFSYVGGHHCRGYCSKQGKAHLVGDSKFSLASEEGASIDESLISKGRRTGFY